MQGGVEQPGQHRAGFEILPCDLTRAADMAIVARVDRLDPGDSLFRRREREQAFARRQVRSPAGVLNQCRPSGGEIALGAIAEPARTRGHIRVLRHAELGFRLLDEVAILSGRARHRHGVDRVPAELPQQLLRSVDGELERLRRPRRHVHELDELLILVAADVGEALDLPGHHRGEAIPRRGVRAPVGHGHRLPGFVPAERAGRNRAGGGGADVGAEGEEMIEALEELHVPRLGLGDGELGERRIGIDEHASRDTRVLVAPEPGAARQVDVQVSVGAEPAQARSAVEDLRAFGKRHREQLRGIRLRDLIDDGRRF